MDALKLVVTNQCQDQFRALSTPDFQQIEESLSTANNSNVDLPLLRVYTLQSHNHRKNDEGHANHLHLPSCLLRMLKLNIGRVQMIDALQLYLALFLGLIPLPTKIQEDLIPYVRFVHSQPEQSNPQISDNVIQLPFWAIISFGAYLLGKLGYNVMTFHDVPEAHKELMAEIEIARADLKKMGVTVD